MGFYKVKNENRRLNIDLSVQFVKKIQCRALVDTGTTMTGVAPHIIKDIQAVKIGSVPIANLHNEVEQREKYKILLHINFSDGQYTQTTQVFAFKGVDNLGYDVLLGMDVLERLHFTYTPHDKMLLFEKPQTH